MALFKSGLNNEHISLIIDPFTLRKMHFGTETNGFNSESGLNFEWSL